MDTNRIRHFCTVYETSHLGKASELLFISKGGLSKSLKTLENEINIKLLIGEGRGLRVTDAGHRFYARAKKFLEAEQDLLQSEGDKSLNHELKIGTFEVFSTYFMGKLAKDVLADYDLVLRETVPGKLEEALLNHTIDYGITYIPIPSKGIEYSKICDLKMGVFGKADKFDNQELEHLPFAAPVIPIAGSPSSVKGLDGWPDDKVNRLIKFKVDMMETAMELCRQGQAVGFFPSFVVNLHNEQVLSKYKLDLLQINKQLKEIVRPIYIVKRIGTEEGKAMKKLARGLRQTTKEYR